MASAILTASTRGFQNATSYDRHRPSFPASAVDSLLRHLQVHAVKGARIVDLAAGTGKFTQLLSEREEGYEIIAVEPHDTMRAELERKRFERVRVLKGWASEMVGVESQNVDAVIAAQVRTNARGWLG